EGEGVEGEGVEGEGVEGDGVEGDGVAGPAELEEEQGLEVADDVEDEDEEQGEEEEEEEEDPGEQVLHSPIPSQQSPCASHPPPHTSVG
ncbi:hypothetical protein COU78_04540, partial [Candidatus Peregrinibacteria bacterium CG10_big_fil_rev_8_21_14_0_10_49_24]